MGDDWKYIVFDLPESPTAVLFPPHITHADMARRFRPAVALSAGFVRWDGERQEFACYGRSDSLDIDPTDDDAFYVNRLLPR
jgi:hypothetical protein